MRVFEHALIAAANLTGHVRNDFLSRLDRVRSIGRQLGNGVAEDMDVLLSEFESSACPRGFMKKSRRAGAGAAVSDHI